MGLESSGWKVVFANDIDPKKKEMHDAHWGPSPEYRLEDVFSVRPEELPAAELAWASFPCVDLSLAGNRAGLDGQSSGAYWGFYGLLKGLGAEARPPLVVLENVAGMLTSRDGEDLATIVAGLNALGYVVDLLEIDAAKFTPQSRPRIFVIGARGPYTLGRESERAASSFRPGRVQAFISRFPQLSWGAAPVGPDPVRVLTLSDTLERFPGDADVWWSDSDCSKLLNQMSERHLRAAWTLAAFPTQSFATVYRRMRPSGYRAEVRLDGLAGCLRTPRGGSSRQFVLEMGRGAIRARRMTAVEYGRLQGASGFRIKVPELQALYGFGDAVCVPAVAWIAENVLGPIRARAEIGVA